MKKIALIIIGVVIIGFIFTSFSHRDRYSYGDRHEGIISQFTGAAARGAGAYVGYRAAKSLFSSHDRHRDYEHHYSRHRY